MNFTKAIVRKPCKNMFYGLTTANMGKPDYKKALKQHDAYIEALQECGLKIQILDADENHPDSVFVEDVAVLTDKFALITNPGADERKNEVIQMEDVLKDFYENIERINREGILDGGDIMQCDKHFYIGISKRTDNEGAKQFSEILKKYKMTSERIPLFDILHLKTGISYIGNDTLSAIEQLGNLKTFLDFEIITVKPEEAYAANNIRVNDKLIIPSGYPDFKSKAEEKGFNTICLDMSEFQKLDGGLSCLSLRF